MEETKKEAKTRTSITIDPAVLNAARKHCEQNNLSVSSLIERLLADKFGFDIHYPATTASAPLETAAQVEV